MKSQIWEYNFAAPVPTTLNGKKSKKDQQVLRFQFAFLDLLKPFGELERQREDEESKDDFARSSQYYPVKEIA